MDEKSIVVQISALVHDIGKLAQRAKGEKSPEDAYLQPSIKGQLSHWHVLYTDYFVKNHLPLPVEVKHKREDIALIASIHHNANEDMLEQMCVAVADRLAAGMDRLKTDRTEDFRTARLNSILEEVALTKDAPSREDLTKRMKLLPFQPSKDVFFPVDQKKNEDKKDDEFVQEYKELYENFLKELKKMPEDLPYKHYLPWLLRIMEKYLWCVPSSSYKALPDISLYDHSVVTASVAQALWMYHRENQDIKLSYDSLEEEKFILFGGDLSGIQKYIFGISQSGTTGAVRIFRARSFYLQALTKSIILYICKKVGLSLLCQIMDAGGKFILLLPKIKKVLDLMDSLGKEVDEFFVSKFKGELGLCLAHMNVSGKDLLLGNFENTLDEFNFILDKNKKNKFRSYLSLKGSVIHKGYSKFKDSEICSICEKEPAEKEGDLCKTCWNQINVIGRKIPKAEYIVFSNSGIDLFRDIKLHIQTAKDGKIETHIKNAQLILGVGDKKEFGTIWLAGYIPTIKEDELKDKEFLKKVEQEYTDRNLTEIVGEAKTFGLIAHKALTYNEQLEKNLGRALLCVLKADVDNLGLIFSIGLKNRLSVSRFASLSRMLNSFFSGYLVNKIRENPKYQDTYVVFAGGDDLFLIGPWHQTIDLAVEINEEFKEFCANNKDFSMSCGLYLIKPHYPIRRAAPKAEELLEKAKSKMDDNMLLKKNSVCVFDKVLGWGELKKQIEIGKILEQKAIDDESPIKKAFLYRLLQYTKDAIKFEYKDSFDISTKEYIRCGLYLSHFLYDISRNIMKVKDGKIVNSDEVQFLTNLLNIENEAKSFAQNIVGIQYALCAIRE